MEQQLEAARSELKNKQVTGVSGAGLVTVVMNGEKEMLSIQIKPECVDPNDLEGLQDLIKDACEQAYAQIATEDPIEPVLSARRDVASIRSLTDSSSIVVTASRQFSARAISGN